MKYNAYICLDLIQVFKDLDLQYCDILYNTIAFAVDQFIPSTDKPISSKSGKAWVKQEQKNCIKNKRRAWNIYYRNKTPEVEWA